MKNKKRVYKTFIKEGEPIYKYTDAFHRLLNVSNYHPDEHIVKRAKATLAGWHTAGGPDLLKKEAEQILSEIEDWEKNLLHPEIPE